MKTLTILLLPLVFAMAACQGTSREIIREKAVGGGGPSEWGDPSSDYGGVDSSGGGSSHENRMLESYKKDIRKHPIYLSKVHPILMNLAKANPRVASDLLHIAVERSWYFLPGRLDKIPSQRIGAHVKTDQIALQNRTEVWVDENLFGELVSDDERAVLILHELVMGLRMMSFQDALDECLSGIAINSLDTSEDSPYPLMRKTCFRNAGGLTGGRAGGGLLQKPIRISKEEYLLIRPLVSWLWESGGRVDGEELSMWLKLKGFRTYPEN